MQATHQLRSMMLTERPERGTEGAPLACAEGVQCMAKEGFYSAAEEEVSPFKNRVCGFPSMLGRTCPELVYTQCKTWELWAGSPQTHRSNVSRASAQTLGKKPNLNLNLNPTGQSAQLHCTMLLGLRNHMGHAKRMQCGNPEGLGSSYHLGKTTAMLYTAKAA